MKSNMIYIFIQKYERCSNMLVERHPLSLEEREELLNTLKKRFEYNIKRHENISWEKVKAKLEANPNKLESLYLMESTGGEPDVIGYDEATDELIYCDFSIETPSGRRSICYDKKALDARKANKPVSSAMQMAEEMGIELLTEEQYFKLQELGSFDNKTSSWLKTPQSVRDLGGAIFGDKRYGRTFIYNNGADSYYGVRGFRGLLKI